jgi:hypothetical protein
MPDSVTVVAFVFGFVLLIAAFIGKELKIAAVEMPALNRYQRLIAAAVGILLVVFGMTEGRGFEWVKTPRSAATSLPKAVAAPKGGETGYTCFTDVPEADRILVAVEKKRRADRKFSSGQPRTGLIAIEFSRDGTLIGGVKYNTLGSGLGFDILSVVDEACNPITTYSNASREDQPKEAPYNYDTLHYEFGDTIIAMDISYSESNDQIYLRAEDISP